MIQMLRKKYPFLDGLRGFSILWVVIFHLDLVRFLPDQPNLEIVTKFIGSGHFGVDIFFVISGFLITGLLLDQNNNNVNILRFYAHRAFKILPSYYFLILCLICFAYLNHTLPSVNDFVRYITFTQNHFQNEFGHLWSITVEENFYLAYPLIIYVSFKAVPQAYRQPILLLTLTGIIIFCLIYKLTTNLPNNTLANIDALSFGCMIRILEHQLTEFHPKTKKIISTLCFIISLVLWAILISHWKHYHMRLLNFLAAGLLIISCLLEFKPLIKFLEFKFLRYIGKLSYNLYLWHYPLLLLTPQEIRNNPLTFVPYVLGTTFFMGWFTTITVEKFFLNIRERKFPHLIGHTRTAYN